jgi:hypothetical protein
MASAVQQRPQLNGVPKKPTATRAPVKKPYTPAPAAARKNVNGALAAPKSAAPVPKKAASIAGETGGGVTSAYAIMASRIANRVAEMAESITFVER